MANNINEVDEFGDLPPNLLKRLSQILSKRRVLTSRTLDLFLRSDLETIDIYDCGKLETEDYIRIFSYIPTVRNINLRNTGQIKDEVLDYIMERDIPLRQIQLEAANLVTNEKWIDFFQLSGHRLETLKLTWLDFAMDETAFYALVQSCPNLSRLKLKKCFKLGNNALKAISGLKDLQHLSLQLNQPISPETLADLLVSVGSGLETLSLQTFNDADDKVLSTIHDQCTKLRKFRLTDNDVCTDVGFVSLFTEWFNPPLSFIDLSSTRSLDYEAPDGPEEAIGLASAGFKAMMKHSGLALERLDVSSCRHISHDTFASVFDGKEEYPMLKELNLSFLTKVDTPIVAGVFKSCPKLNKLTTFGCFNVTDVQVPVGVALIGLPNAQDSIVQGDLFQADLAMDFQLDG